MTETSETPVAVSRLSRFRYPHEVPAAERVGFADPRRQAASERRWAAECRVAALPGWAEADCGDPHSPNRREHTAARAELKAATAAYHKALATCRSPA